MGDEWVVIDNVNWVHHALLLKSVLESAGIEALVPDEHTLNANPGYVSALGGVRIMVRAGDVEKAREILRTAAPDAKADAEALVAQIAEVAQKSERGVIAALIGPDREAAAHEASSIARAAGRELVRVDLAAVISKYAGETEKHLDRVFADAERSGAILFFDEADALFGTEPDRPPDRGTVDTIQDWFCVRRKTGTAVILLAIRDFEPVGERFRCCIDYIVSCGDV